MVISIICQTICNFALISAHLSPNEQSFEKKLEVNGIVYNIIDSINKELCVSKVLKDGEIIIPDSIHFNDGIFCVTQISSHVFDSSKVTSIILPYSISSIAPLAFEECPFLSKLILNSKAEIGTSTIFGSKHKLTSAGPIGSGSDFEYSWTDSIPVSLFRSGKFKTVIIPEGITKLPSSLFAYSDLESIKLPTTLRLIEERVFFSCHSLKRIELPSNVEEIGYSAFSNCISLETVILPNNLKIIPAGCFQNCWSLSNLTIPKSVLGILQMAFMNCTNLKQIKIPNSVLFIGKHSFENCINLSTLFVEWYQPDTLFIEAQAFNSTSITLDVPYGTVELYESLCKNNISWEQIARITDGHYSTSEKSFNNNGIIFRITNPEKRLVNIAGNYASGEIVIPPVVSSPFTQIEYIVAGIDERAFYDNSRLISLEISNGPLAVPQECFSFCTNLKYLILPNSIKELGVGSFSGCFNLELVHIPKKVISIPDNLFDNCKKIKYLKLPRRLKVIGVKAFQGCSSLESLIIPKNVESIGESAFYGCSNISSITIPKKVPKITNSVFMNCDNLHKIKIKGKRTSIEDSAFDNCPVLNELIFPKNVNFKEGYTSTQNY